MIGFALFCIQICFVQYTFSQAVAAGTTINNVLPTTFGPSALSPASLATNMAQGLSGQMMTGGIPAAAFGQMGAQNLGPMGAQTLGVQNQMALTQNQMAIAQNQMGMPAAMAANAMATGFGSNYGGNGSGDVAVAGELPVAGTTAITGQVPLAGKVAFTGTLPAGGIVTISGQCGCGANGQLNAGFAPKSGYNNKPYNMY